jgi:hypothetical protein
MAKTEDRLVHRRATCQDVFFTAAEMGKIINNFL